MSFVVWLFFQLRTLACLMINISGKTKLIGVIADPIDHVMAPQLFNPLFAQLEKDISLVPLHIEPQQLKKAYNGLLKINNLLGILITVPHKEAIVAYIDNLEAEANFCSCVNVVKFDHGISYGQTFDGIGFVNGLTKVYGEDILKNKRVLVVGAGGAALAICYSLVKEGIQALAIKNRNQKRAKNLINKLNMLSNNISLFKQGYKFDIIINTTTLGLNPDDPLPYDINLISKESLVIDIIMKPKETKFLRLAKERGFLVHFGLDMLKGQQAEILNFLDSKTNLPSKNRKIGY